MSVAPGFLHSIWANTQESEAVWHELIDRVQLQGLIRPLSAIIQVQYGSGGIWFVPPRYTCAWRGTAPHDDPSINFISMFPTANRQTALTGAYFGRVFVAGFSFLLFKWILIFIFDIWLMVCYRYATFGCESQKFAAWVVSKQQRPAVKARTEAN